MIRNISKRLGSQSPASLRRVAPLIGIAGIALVSVLALIGCDTDTGTSDLPVSTVEWQLGGDGFIQFYTNDSQHYERTFWKLYENRNGSTYEIECKKISGNQTYEYGMVFGASDTSHFYGIMITAGGGYRVFKNNGGTRTTIKDWATTDKLYTGYNQINVIKVTQSGTTYTVYLNTSQVYQFPDSSITGGKLGYQVSIGTQEAESFPNTPVDVRFRQR